MAKIHALERSGNNFQVAIHTAVPAGNNVGGETWASVVIATGHNTSTLNEGTDPGEITTAELAQITAGALIEIRTTIQIDANNATIAAINAMADLEIANFMAAFQQKYGYYGYTQG